MFIKRTLGAVAIAGAALATTAIPAMAAPHPAVETKPGPSTTRVAPTASHAPTMSPAADKTLHTDYGVGSITCKKGWLCVDAWDPTTNSWKVFELYTCKTRNLSYFKTGNTSSEIINKQTGGVTTYFTNKAYHEVDKSKAPQSRRGIDWDPVWHIDVC